MKKNRFLALLTAALLLLAPMAQATSHIAFFHQGEGVEMVAMREVSDLTVPEGLAPLYAFFSEGNPLATVYVFRMPNGRALLSISCLEMDAPGSTEALLENKDALAAGLMASMPDSLTAAPEFQLTEIYGQQALVAAMSLKLDGLMVDAQAAIFYRGEDLIEVWTACPNASHYLFDDAAAAELKSDLAELVTLEESLDFSIPEDSASTAGDDLQQSGMNDEMDDMLDYLQDLDSAGSTIAQPADKAYMTVTADDGLFRMDVPLDTVLLHAGSDENTVARARQLLAHIDGGEECFDLWYQDVKDQNAWLLISREHRVAAQVFVSEVGSFAGMTPEDLITLETPVLQMMQEQYEHASVADESCVYTMDGMEHAWLTYDLKLGDMNLLTFVLAAVDENYLYEMDVYAQIDDQLDKEALIDLLIMMLETLDYLPEQTI